MSYLLIKDFKQGMDRTRSRRASVPGSLWLAKNVHLTSGGVLERRKRFVPEFTGLNGTAGLASLNGQVYTFTGLGANPAGSIVTQDLPSPTGLNFLERVLDWDVFNAKLYVVGEMNDGSVYHYYDGVRVSAWDGIAASFSSFADIAAVMAAKINASSAFSAVSSGPTIVVTGTGGSDFTHTGSAINGGTVDDQAIVFSVVQNAGTPAAETRATGTLEVTGGSAGSVASNSTATITIRGAAAQGGTVSAVATNSVNLLDGPVSFPPAIDPVYGPFTYPENLITSEVVGSINNGTGTHGYSAVANSNGTITLTGPAAANGNSVTVSQSGFTSANGTFSGGGTGTNLFSAVTVNGVDVLGFPVAHTGSNATTAAALANRINSYTSAPNYTATAAGAVVTIRAGVGTGAGPNGFVVNASVVGDPTFTPANMASGVTASATGDKIVEATLVGTVEPGDRWTITLNNIDFVVDSTDSGMGRTAWTYGSKVYSLAGSVVRYSGLNDPMSWSPDVIGAGYINMASQNSGDQELLGMDVFQDRTVAILARTTIHLYDLFEDDDNTVRVSTVENSGTVAGRSVEPFGNSDLFYLSDSGVRSLRAQGVDGNIGTEDVGTPIDGFVLDHMDSVGEAVFELACAAIEPRANRYWLAVGKLIFVFAFYQSAKVSGWTYYDLSDEIGDDISDILVVNGRVRIRAGNVIYLYGGADNDDYGSDGDYECDIILPFLSFDDPGSWKSVKSFLVDGTGVWDMRVLPNPDNDTFEELVGAVSLPSFTSGHVPFESDTTHMGLRFTTDRGGPATLAGLSAYFPSKTHVR